MTPIESMLKDKIRENFDIYIYVHNNYVVKKYIYLSGIKGLKICDVVNNVMAQYSALSCVY